MGELPALPRPLAGFKGSYTSKGREGKDMAGREGRGKKGERGKEGKGEGEAGGSKGRGKVASWLLGGWRPLMLELGGAKTTGILRNDFTDYWIVHWLNGFLFLFQFLTRDALCAQRGIAIVSRPSVRLSVRLSSVRLRYRGRIA